MKKFFNWLYIKIKTFLFFRKVNKTDYEKLTKCPLWFEKHPVSRSSFNLEIEKEFNNAKS